MKKIGKLADECSSLDTKVADSVAPFDRKVQSLQRRKDSCGGCRYDESEVCQHDRTRKGVETNIESANLKASDAVKKGQAVSKSRKSSTRSRVFARSSKRPRSRARRTRVVRRKR